MTAYLPGSAPVQLGPLGRYLPPLMEGTGAAWLRQNLPGGGWVLDPFGASPQLVVEIAQAGCRVLAAVNNPILRFLIELKANPPGKEDFRAALADLASAQKAGERIEPHLRALYLTECAKCGNRVEAQAFIWERESNTPTGRIYNCPVCKDNAERPAVQFDSEQAIRLAASGLHRARALERVTALDDPDRAYAEEALAAYLPRAVYVLLTLVNKLDGLPAGHRRLAAALLLAAFDQANTMWAHPPTRSRPRQIYQPPRFLEKNIWLALEAAVDNWTASLEGEPTTRQPVRVTIWPELPPTSGGICLYEGRLKDLAAEIRASPHEDLKIQAVVAALPRPNQAFWTLSALWAGWLWGRAASSSFKSVLRRRRYDWAWHTVALQSALSSLAPLLEQGTPCLGVVSEAEAGFLSAAILAAEQANLELREIALRTESSLAQIHWRRGADKHQPGLTTLEQSELIQQSAIDYLRERGEPAGYLQLHSVALAALVKGQALPVPPQPAAEIYRQTEDIIASALAHSSRFVRYAGSSRSLEVGLWWLDESSVHGIDIAQPLTERLEIALVRYLQSHPDCQLHEIDKALCQQLPGLFTPDLELIESCLGSYGEQDPPESGRWRLRAEDFPQARRSDLEELSRLLVSLGRRLGYQVSQPAPEEMTSSRSPVIWETQDGATAYLFHLIASGVMGRFVLPHPGRPMGLAQPGRNVILLPGGRAGWVELKLRRDPRLRGAVEAGWHMVKYRHIRRLADYETLNRDNFEEHLKLDPLANRDPQMTLL